MYNRGMINKSVLDNLLAENLLSRTQYDRAVSALPAEPWAEWGPRRLLALGGVLLLAAVICFFAYNWADMGLLLKLGLPLAGLVLCGASVWRYGPSSVPGQIFAAGAGVLCGVFTAVCGQAFQLQSYVYEWFAAWSVMMAVLAAVSGVRWLWLGAFLAWGMFAEDKYGFTGGFYPLASAAVLFWALTEGCIWLKKWPENFRAWAFIPAAFYLTSCAAYDTLRRTFQTPSYVCAVFILAAAWLAVKKFKSPMVLGVSALCAAVWVSCWLVRMEVFAYQWGSPVFMCVFALAGAGAWKGIEYMRRTK